MPPKNKTKFGESRPRRDFAAEAAKETDASLAAAIAKLEVAVADGGISIGLVNGQLHAYRKEQQRRKSAPKS